MNLSEELPFYTMPLQTSELFQKNPIIKRLYSRSLHWFPEYEVMEQSQVKPSHCCMQTPWLAHESSWQVVLGPSNAYKKKKRGREEKVDRNVLKFIKFKAIT